MLKYRLNVFKLRPGKLEESEANNAILRIYSFYFYYAQHICRQCFYFFDIQPRAAHWKAPV